MNILKKILHKPYRLCNYLYNKLFTKNLFKTQVNKWFLLNGDNKYLINHNLNKDSIVFEVWWYTWVFTDKIIEKYNCNIYVFEPIKEFYHILVNKYKNNKKIKVFNIWLSNKNEKIIVSKSKDATSVFKNSWEKEEIEIIDIKDFIKENQLENLKIDLMSINIEWWEYPLVERLLEIIPNNVLSYQIQFHDFIDNAESKRNNILNLLEKNNYKKWYSFPFVWELFKK